MAIYKLYLPCLKLSDPELNTDLSREYQGAPTGFLKKNLSDRGTLFQAAKKNVWDKTQKLSDTVFSTVWKELVYSRRELS